MQRSGLLELVPGASAVSSVAFIYQTLSGPNEFRPTGDGPMGAVTRGVAAGGAALATGRGAAEERSRIAEGEAGGEAAPERPRRIKSVLTAEHHCWVPRGMRLL